MEASRHDSFRSRISGSKLVWLIASLISLVGLFSPNPLETAVASFLPVVLLQILWRPGEPQVLLMALWMQSIQVITPLVVFNRDGLSMASVYSSQAYSNALYFSALALISLALSARLGAGSSLRRDLLKSSILEDRLNPKSLFQCYVLFLGVHLVIPFIASQAGGFAQLVLPLSSVRLVFAYYIIKSNLRKRKIGLDMLAILIIETIIGLSGFFASFKLIYIVMVLAALSVGSGLRNLFRPQALALITMFVILVSYWQFIKPTYRSFASQGSISQVVTVPLSERINFHFSALSKIKPDDLALGLDVALDRFGYLKFFAGSIQQVPSVVPYQGGRLWNEAIEFSLKPRVLFPDKGVANDSDRTNAFSGIRVTGVDKGTSISIGYVGESYIDFGFPLMLGPIAAMGWLFGRLYRILILMQPVTPLNVGAAIILILGTATTYESSNLKLLPAVLLSFFTYWLLLKLVHNFGARYWAWLTLP